MSRDWNWATVDEIKAQNAHAISMGPFGSDIKTDNFIAKGIPVIRGVNLSKRRFYEEGFVYISEEKANELKSANAYPGDIIFTHRGTLGQVSIIPRDSKYKRYVISQSQMKLTCDSTKADPLFIFYYFRSPVGQRELLKHTSTTGVPALSHPLTSLKSIRVPLPSIVEQCAIANVLDCLDAKIELNSKINATLEAFAEAIFKRWFVDFEFPDEFGKPYKSNGGELVSSEAGEIPKSWRLSTLSEVLEIHDSKRIPLSSRERAKMRGPYRYYGATSVIDYVDNYLFDGTYVLLGEDGSVIKEDGTPVVQYVWGKFWVNNHAHVLTAGGGLSTEQLFLLLKQVNISPYVSGAVQLKLNQNNLKAIPFVLPPHNVCVTFKEAIDSLFQMYRANVEQSGVLNHLRDTLLPRLISGKISTRNKKRCDDGAEEIKRKPQVQTQSTLGDRPEDMKRLSIN